MKKHRSLAPLFPLARPLMLFLSDRSSHMSWLFIFALCSATLVASQGQVNVENTQALYAALSNTSVSAVWLTAPFEISSTEWPGQVNISRRVLVFSPYRVVLDWCDEACNNGTAPWPLINVLSNGNLQFTRILFRNFVRKTPVYSPEENSPVPAVRSLGGTVGFLLVVWHWQPSMLWVFNESTWWQKNQKMMKSVAADGHNENQPVQFETPRLYVLSGSTPDGTFSFTNSFSPMDLLGCYGDLPFHITIIYCPFTFRDSILNPHVDSAVIFHSIGLDRTVYDYWAPWTLKRPVHYTTCPGVNVTFDMDWMNSVAVVDTGGVLSFSNVKFVSSFPQNRTKWPPEVPLLLSAFDPVNDGAVILKDCVIEVQNTSALAAALLKLPDDSSLDPHRPNLQPHVVGNLSSSQYTISDWDLRQASYLTYISGSINPATFGANCYWSFQNVTVVEGRQPWCFSGGVNLGSITPSAPAKVSSCAQLVNSLNDGSLRYIEIVSDILCKPEDAPRDGLYINRPVEIRACHPTYGERYVIDFGPQAMQLVIAQRFYLEGDLTLRVHNLSDFHAPLVRALPFVSSLQTNALMQVEAALISFSVPGAATDVEHVSSRIGISTNLENVTVVNDNSLRVDFLWQNVTDPAAGISGIASYVGASFNWGDGISAPSATGSSPDTSSSSSSTPIAAIVVPIVVVSVVVLLAIAGYFVWRRNHSAKRGANLYDTESSEATSAAIHSKMFLVDGKTGYVEQEDTLSKSNSNAFASSSKLGPCMDIEAACKQMVTSKTSSANDTLILSDLLGEGAYGKVYLGSWNGTAVAVKIMILPSYLSGKEKRERMAIMETAISSSLSHPNIVQTYTYAVEPVKVKAASERPMSHADASTISVVQSESDAAEVYSWEVRLVQEYCDKGSLRDFLSARGFMHEAQKLDFLGIVDTAIDIARAMAHLHRENVIHSDLKARNVLLKGCTTDPRGLVAKVADFGLSMKIDPEETHISNAFQGTMTHMAPETLMHGHVSFASDVYSFGILLWELYTGGQAFKGVAKALLGHQVTQDNLRPVFPLDTPFEFQFLAFRCWESDPSIRPNFDRILEDLKTLRRQIVSGGSSIGLNTWDTAGNGQESTGLSLSESHSSYLQDSTYLHSSSGCARRHLLPDPRLHPVAEDVVDGAEANTDGVKGPEQV